MPKPYATINIRAYRPLIIVIGVVLLTSLALAQPTLRLKAWMDNFMGLFFVVFALFKLINIQGFADGFQKYDLIAKRLRGYAYVYPIIELVLGLLYLSGYYLYFTTIATLLLMLISATGVFFSLAQGIPLKCACLGTALNVPLSTVSIIENLGMGMMAIAMLLFL